MKKHIIEPIFMYDKLELLSNDKVQFEILLKDKDLKLLSKERKEDLLRQRVHFTEDVGFVVECNLDESF
jgi:hypothetical protein